MNQQPPFDRIEHIEKIMQCHRKAREYKEASAAIDYLARVRQNQPEHPTLTKLANTLGEKAENFSKTARMLGEQGASCQP